jgi:hypothetical protein
MKPYQKLVGHWRGEGLTIVTGAPEEALLRFEAKYNATLSTDLDFREYLLNVDGMAQVGGKDCDQKGFAFWPLNRIRSVPEECVESKVGVPRVDDVGKYFVFADYMQWSWAYAIGVSPNQEGQILQFGTSSPRIVAYSFSEFVEAYVRDSGQLYLPPSLKGTGVTPKPRRFSSTRSSRGSR